MNAPQHTGPIQQRQIAERVVYGLVSLLGFVISIGALYELSVHPEPKRSLGDSFGSVLRWEFFLGLLLFSGLGLAWAITGSQRLDERFSRASGRVLLLLALWLIVGAVCGFLFG